MPDLNEKLDLLRKEMARSGIPAERFHEKAFYSLKKEFDQRLDSVRRGSMDVSGAYADIGNAINRARNEKIVTSLHAEQLENTYLTELRSLQEK
jgi:hypothetical protein